MLDAQQASEGIPSAVVHIWKQGGKGSMGKGGIWQCSLAAELQSGVAMSTRPFFSRVALTSERLLCQHLSAQRSQGAVLSITFPSILYYSPPLPQCNNLSLRTEMSLKPSLFRQYLLTI